MAGGVDGRNVQGHKVRAGQQTLQVIHFFHATGKTPGRFHRDGRIEPHYLHAQLQRHVGDNGPDGAKADHSQGFIE